MNAQDSEALKPLFANTLTIFLHELTKEKPMHIDGAIQILELLQFNNSRVGYAIIRPSMRMCVNCGWECVIWIDDGEKSKEVRARAYELGEAVREAIIKHEKRIADEHQTP